MSIGENIMKHWKYYAIVTALVSIGGWIYTQGGNDKAVESRLFSTPEVKYETEKYILQKPSPEQEQRAYILDSIKDATEIKNNESARKSRARRDSIYLKEVKARKKTDSIVLLNADQLYQIKEQLKRINN